MTENPEQLDMAMDAWLGVELNNVIKCRTCSTIVNTVSKKLDN